MPLARALHERRFLAPSGLRTFIHFEEIANMQQKMLVMTLAAAVAASFALSGCNRDSDKRLSQSGATSSTPGSTSPGSSGSGSLAMNRGGSSSPAAPSSSPSGSDRSSSGSASSPSAASSSPGGASSNTDRS